MLDRIIPSILLASPEDAENDSNSDSGEFDLGEPISDDGPPGDDPDDPEDDSDDSKDDLSDKSKKKNVRVLENELEDLKSKRAVINDAHSAAQDISDHEVEETEVKKLEVIDKKIEKQEEELKDLYSQTRSNKWEIDSDDDDDDNNRRGGPSAGTTGGSSEGGSSEGGSSEGGSSRVKSESPLDFVLELESLEMSSFLDDID